jgi:hypothetical protein
MSTSKNHFDFLISRIKNYIEVNDEEIEIINSLFVEEHFKKNTVLLREGEVCRKLLKKRCWGRIYELRFI